jgi:hypothetical protein
VVTPSQKVANRGLLSILSPSVRFLGTPILERKISRCFFIDPSVDFDVVDPAQLPDLVFDLFGIQNGFFSFQVELHPINIVRLNCSHP